jgi:hypothetical protein
MDNYEILKNDSVKKPYFIYNLESFLKNFQLVHYDQDKILKTFILSTIMLHFIIEFVNQYGLVLLMLNLAFLNDQLS